MLYQRCKDVPVNFLLSGPSIKLLIVFGEKVLPLIEPEHGELAVWLHNVDFLDLLEDDLLNAK